MSFSSQNLPGNLASTKVVDPDVGNTVQYAYAGAKNLVGVYLDNTGGSNPAFVRFWDATSGVTNGTTVPEHIFFVPGNKARMISIPIGLAFSTGIAYCGSNSPGTPGTTAPTTTLKMTLLLE